MLTDVNHRQQINARRHFGGASMYNLTTLEALVELNTQQPCMVDVEVAKIVIFGFYNKGRRRAGLILPRN